MDLSTEEALFSILDLPNELVAKILSYFKYSEIATLRAVCKHFDNLCQSLLNQGFHRADRLHQQIHKEIKAKLPRRESERRSSPYARHTEILSAVETRLSLLSMTYQKHIDLRTVCFIPGKVLDELIKILEVVRTTAQPPRAHEFLQELRDISSMAMEHFEERILPEIRRLEAQKERERFRPYVFRTNSSSLRAEVQAMNNLVDQQIASASATASPFALPLTSASFCASPFITTPRSGCTSPLSVVGATNHATSLSLSSCAGCCGAFLCEFGKQLREHGYSVSRNAGTTKPKLEAAEAKAEGSSAQRDCESSNELNVMRQQLDSLQKQHSQFQARLASLEMQNQVLERKLKDLNASNSRSEIAPSGSNGVTHPIDALIPDMTGHNSVETSSQTSTSKLRKRRLSSSKREVLVKPKSSRNDAADTESQSGGSNDLKRSRTEMNTELRTTSSGSGQRFTRATARKLAVTKA